MLLFKKQPHSCPLRIRISFSGQVNDFSFLAAVKNKTDIQLKTRATESNDAFYKNAN